MRHSVYGKKLSRTNDERKRLFRSLLCDLFRLGSITTTKAKAKAILPVIDKLITKAKEGKETAYAQLLQAFDNAGIAHQLIVDAKGRFSSRTSGYTRMIKLSHYRKDAADVVKLSFVDELVATDIIKPQKKTKNISEKKNLSQGSAPAGKSEVKEKKVIAKKEKSKTQKKAKK